LTRRKSKDKDPLEEEFESDNEVASTPLDVFKIYYPIADDIFVDLIMFVYDPVTKHITKETNCKILKEYGT